MSDDPGVREQTLDVALAEASDSLGIEVLERLPKALALAQDREPGQPRLEALEAKPFVEAALVQHWPAPFLVVVGDVRRVVAAPAAPDLCHATETLTIPSTTRT